MKAQVLRRKRKAVSQVADEVRLLEGKERIANAAAILFLNGGYHSTSVREIAQKAGLSVGSVFNYFTSKVENFVVEMDNSSAELIDYFLKQRRR